MPWLVERTHGDAAECFAGCVARDEQRALRRCVLAGERGKFVVKALVAEINRERGSVGAKEFRDDGEIGRE